MPFKRDLIESDCVLKTFDGDISNLERAIDFTLKKPEFSQKSETTIAAPVSSNIASIAATPVPCVPSQKRHIKEVVYGDDLDELPSSLLPAARPVSQTISKKEPEIPATASGFCFRHIVEDAGTIASTLQSACSDATSQSVVPATRPPYTPAQTSAEVIRVSRSVKDVVYGEIDFDEHCAQSSQIKRSETEEQPQIVAKHFKACMREDLPIDSVPRASPAVRHLSTVVAHAHWRSEIHGF